MSTGLRGYGDLQISQVISNSASYLPNPLKESGPVLEKHLGLARSSLPLSVQTGLGLAHLPSVLRSHLERSTSLFGSSNPLTHFESAPWYTMA